MLVELGPPGPAATAFTPGMSKSSFSAISPTRLLSASEMPGLKVMLTVNEPSLNGGRKARGRFQAATPAATTAAATVPTSRPLWRKATRSRAALPRLSSFRKRLSCSSRFFKPGSSRDASTGVRVIEVSRLARIEMM